MDWKLCSRNWSEIISGKPKTPQHLSGGIEECSYTLDQDSKSPERVLKMRLSV
jgi:hypothetical protein